MLTFTSKATLTMNMVNCALKGVVRDISSITGHEGSLMQQYET